jgi:outer membrane protein insertion porin family
LLITKGPPVYFNRVLVAGNTKTRDNVVRRELLATEQELYSGAKITQSKNALQRTGYFEDVNVTTKKTDQPDTVDVLVDVKEGPTGNFSVGAGYSSGDGFLFNATVAEKNLMGRGQGVNGSFSLGSKRQDFVVGFTEPYVAGSDVSAGFDGFNTRRDYTDFTEKRLGFDVRTTYPLKNLNVPFFGAPKPDLSKGSDELASAPAITMWDYMRGGMSYELTHENIGGVSNSASQEIKDEEGSTLTSSITPSFSYDSRDHFFAPTEGTKSAASVKFAGLGGDTRFLKTDLSARWHYPLLKDPNWGGAYVLALGGSAGTGLGLNGGSDLPLFERYFIGGINSVRGFADRSIGPMSSPVCVSSAGSSHNVGKTTDGKNVTKTTCKDLPPTYTDPITAEQHTQTFSYSTGDVMGGNTSAVFNTELLFPIAEQYGLRGVAFYDIGNAWSGGFNFGDFRQSVGVGARWMSPFGPLRVELGFPLIKQPRDETSVLGFSIGSQP